MHHDEKLPLVRVEHYQIQSAYLDRNVTVDVYLPQSIDDLNELSLLLINDGQDLPKMHFDRILNALLETNQVQPLLCVGVHAGPDRATPSRAPSERRTPRAQSAAGI